LASVIGIVAIFVSKLPVAVVAIVDFIAVLVTLAGGVAFAFFLRSANCSETYTLWPNNILNCGGAKKIDDAVIFACKDEATLRARCGLAKAGDAFLFITCVISAIALVLSAIVLRKGKRGAVGNYV
jgi:hypothetical protein